MVKVLSGLFIRVEKTTPKTANVNSGFKRAHRKPKKDL
jgi:hypothetical protein